MTNKEYFAEKQKDGTYVIYETIRGSADTTIVETNIRGCNLKRCLNNHYVNQLFVKKTTLDR